MQDALSWTYPNTSATAAGKAIQLCPIEDQTPDPFPVDGGRLEPALSVVEGMGVPVIALKPSKRTAGLTSPDSLTLTPALPNHLPSHHSKHGPDLF